MKVVFSLLCISLYIFKIFCRKLDNIFERHSYRINTAVDEWMSLISCRSFDGMPLVLQFLLLLTYWFSIKIWARVNIKVVFGRHDFRKYSIELPDYILFLIFSDRLLNILIDCMASKSPLCTCYKYDYAHSFFASLRVCNLLPGHCFLLNI